MKKFVSLMLLGSVLVMCLGLSACGEKGGTLEIVNDTSLLFDVKLLEHDGSTGNSREVVNVRLSPNQKASYSKETDFRCIYELTSAGVNVIPQSTANDILIEGGKSVSLLISKVWP